jgi:hypothetical protein
MLNAPVFYSLAFALICYCDSGVNKRVWVILAIWAAINALLNDYIFAHIEHNLSLILIVYTTLDAIAICFIAPIRTTLARCQMCLILVAWGHQWVTMANIYEPLILAIGICQIILGSNAISNAIGKLIADIRGNGCINHTNSGVYMAHSETAKIEPSQRR